MELDEQPIIYGPPTIMNKQSSELQITMDKADNGNSNSGDSRLVTDDQISKQVS